MEHINRAAAAQLVTLAQESAAARIAQTGASRTPERDAAALAVGIDLAGIRAYAASMTDPADLRGFVDVLASTLAGRIGTHPQQRRAVADQAAAEYDSGAVTDPFELGVLVGVYQTAMWALTGRPDENSELAALIERMTRVGDGESVTMAMLPRSDGMVDVRDYLTMHEDVRDEARAAAVKLVSKAGDRAAQLYHAEIAMRVREDFPDAARIFYYTKPSSTDDSRISIVTSVVDVHDNPLRPADGMDIDDWADEVGVNPLIAQAASLGDEPTDEEDEITIMDILPWQETAEAAQG